MDYDDLERKVVQGGSAQIEIDALVRQLQARVDRQSLVIGVLKEMLLAQSGVSEDEFLERLENAALQKKDSKLCRKCGKALNPRQNRCMYCGEQKATELF